MASIYKRKEMFWISYRQDGRSFCKSLQTTDRSVAEHKKKILEIKIAEGRSISRRTQQRIVDIYPRYLAFLKRSAVKGHFETQRSRINKFLQYSNITFLSQIRVPMFERFLQYRIDHDKISSNTVLAQIVAVKAFLNYCVDHGILAENPLRRIKRPRIEKRPPRFLTKEQGSLLIDLADPPLKYMIAIALNTGVRASELLRLRWEDFDFQSGDLLIRRSKTGEFRSIPISPTLEKHLAPIRKDLGRLFRHKQVPRKRMIRLRRLSGIDFRFHDLRHTFASNLIMDGERLRTVSELLGHKNISTTMIYSHLSDEHKKRAISKVNY